LTRVLHGRLWQEGLSAGSCGVLWVVEITSGAVTTCSSQWCGQVVNKSNLPIQAPSTVTHTNEWQCYPHTYVQVVLVVPFLLAFSPKSCAPSSSVHAFYMASPSYPSWRDHFNYILRRLQVMKLLTMQFSQNYTNYKIKTFVFFLLWWNYDFLDKWLVWRKTRNVANHCCRSSFSMTILNNAVRIWRRLECFISFSPGGKLPVIV
jgi:hypothetical protein